MDRAPSPAGDAAEIMAVQNAYAVAIDRRDWTLLRRCFAAGASIVYGRPNRLGSLDEFLAWAPPFHAELGPTLHQNSSHHSQVTGDTATASCYLHAVLVAADATSALSVFGFYEDELVRTDGRWLIANRVFRPVWRQPNPATPATPPAATTLPAPPVMAGS